jgi:hypothetical protein
MFSCKECNGPCLKECPGTIVDSIASAQKLRGCTHIKGNLEIAIRDGQNIVRELEESLSGIEVISGYLKIFRSFPLISLNFLNNLTEIKGQNLEMKDYTLVVLDNQNLQELWNWTTRPPLKIGSKNIDPKISFHYNPKLCLQVCLFHETNSHSRHLTFNALLDFMCARWVGEWGDGGRGTTRLAFQLSSLPIYVRAPKLTHIQWNINKIFSSKLQLAFNCQFNHQDLVSSYQDDSYTATNDRHALWKIDDQDKDERSENGQAFDFHNLAGC